MNKLIRRIVKNAVVRGVSQTAPHGNQGDKIINNITDELTNIICVSRESREAFLKAFKDFEANKKKPRYKMVISDQSGGLKNFVFNGVASVEIKVDSEMVDDFQEQVKQDQPSPYAVSPVVTISGGRRTGFSVGETKQCDSTENQKPESWRDRDPLF